MSSSRVEVLRPVERRRRFSLEQKLAVLAEAAAPGAVISEVARRHGLLPAQLFKWRRLAALGVLGIPGASELPTLIAVEIAADDGAIAKTPGAADDVRPLTERPVTGLPAPAPTPAPPGPAERPASPCRRPGLIEIDLGGGRCVRVDGDVDAAALRRVLDVLAGR
jgi:transposase